MRIYLKPIIYLIIQVSFFAMHAQVKFYSNPEPVLELNSPDAEDYLYLSADGNELVYLKKKSKKNVGGKQNSGDIWFSDISFKPVLDSIRTNDFNESSQFYSPIGYTSDNRDFLYNNTEFSQGIYVSKVMTYSLENKTKSEVDIPYLKNYSQFPTGFISRNGKYLFLSMDSKTGYGVEDLYVCILDQSGKWSAPKNLGSVINTTKQELTPFLDADNETLYFSTNARNGLGSFDIYFSKRLDDSWRNWTEPKNLGSFVNSEGSETSFMFNRGSEYAYFVSTQNSDGYGDIKRIRIFPTNKGLPSDTVISDKIEIPAVTNYEKKVTFLLTNKKTSAALPFNYIGSVYQDGEEIKYQLFDKTVSHLIFGLNSNDSLDMEFKSKGFLSQSVKLLFEELKTISDTISISLDPLETGNVITLEHVLFHRGTADFIESSKRELELVLEMMNDNLDVNIFLKGHTDNMGNKVLNIQLSQARVNAVRGYLIKRGISKYRISGTGYGGSKPIASNRDEETRKLNRRVEFEVRRD